MGTDVLDFAGLDATAGAAEATNDSETVDTAVDSGTAEATVENTSDGTQTDAAEGSDAAAEGAATGADGKPVVSKEEDLPGTEKTPQEIRKALKAFRDADPKNAAAVKQLHGAFERHEAYKQEFPTVESAREAKAFIELVGGPEGYETLQNIVTSVNESDELLYAADPKIFDNVYEDMKEQGKQDSFGKLASPFLDKLKDVDKKAYYQTLTPHYVASLEASNLPQVLGALSVALEKGDAGAIAEAKALVADMGGWFNSLKNSVEKAKSQAVDPERQKFEAEKLAFTKQQEEYKTTQTKAFQQTVGKESESISNNLLGSNLKSVLKTPYFKAFKADNLKPLASQLQYNLRTELENDKAYQTQMKALWGAKNPDKSKILQVHKIKVESIADRIVRDTVQKMYPDHTKGGSAAGRIAAVAQKKEVAVKNDAAAASTGAAQYVAVKPKNINREMDPKGLLEITGKGYIPNGKGGWRLVTWRKPLT